MTDKGRYNNDLSQKRPRPFDLHILKQKHYIPLFKSD